VYGRENMKVDSIGIGMGRDGDTINLFDVDLEDMTELFQDENKMYRERLKKSYEIIKEDWGRKSS